MPKRCQPECIEVIVSYSAHDDTPTVVIRDRKFVDDVKFALRPYVPIKLGRLDEVVARGFGYRSRAALLARLGVLPQQVDVDSRGFLERLADFGEVAPEDLFMRCILDAASRDNGDLMIGFRGEQVKALGRLTLRLVRFPTDDEWTSNVGESLDWETFMRAFHDNAIPMDRTIAPATDLGGGVIDIAGWRVFIGPDNTWLVVTG